MNRDQPDGAAEPGRTPGNPPISTTAASVADIFAAGVAHHQAGRLGDAEAHYQQVLAAQPEHADALHLLGALAQQIGRHDIAVDLIRQAIRRNPENPAYFCNLGFALRDQVMLDDAVAACREAIRIAPDFAEAHSNLGLALRDQGLLEEAIAAYREAIRIKPGLAEPYSNLGGVLSQQGKLDEAVAACREAIRIRPEFGEAHSNLAAALYQQGELDEAARECREAIRLKPDHAEAHSNLGAVLRDQDKLDEAITACLAAIDIQHFSADAHYNLGNALYDLGRLDETVAAYRQAILFKPEFIQASTSLLTCLNYDERVSNAMLFDAHRAWDERYAKAMPPPAVHGNERKAGRRLKVGYVSADFRQHSVAYFLEPLLAGHDRREVEVFCYAEVGRPDAVTATLQGAGRSLGDDGRDVRRTPRRAHPGTTASTSSSMSAATPRRAGSWRSRASRRRCR